LEVLNPDIDDDGQEDFTLAVLTANVIALAKDVVRGDRTVFGLDLSAALDAVTVPLTDRPLGESLGLGDALRDLIDGESDSDSGDLFEVLHTADFSLFQTILNQGLSDEMVSELARFKLNLDEVPLDFIDDALTFDLSTVLPDTSDVDGRAGIENGRLSGDLVFGIDTNTNPLYLLTAPDEWTPDAVTTLGGDFDLFVNASGEPLGGGLLRLDEAEMRMSPEISLAFANLGVDKLRIGPDLALLRDTEVTLSGHTALNLRADGASLMPGPLTLAAEDDDPLDELPAVSGTLDVASGAIDAEFRRVSATLDGLVQLIAEPAADGTAAVGLSFDPNAAGTDELLVLNQLSGAIDALTLNGVTPGFSLPSLTVRHDGTVEVPPLSVEFDGGLGQYIGIGGVLPFDISRLTLAFPDPSNLDTLLLGVEGEFDFESLDLPFNAEVSVGDSVLDGAFEAQIDLASAREGLFRPIDFGPMTLAISDFVLPDTGVTLAGELQIGRLDANGDPQPLPDSLEEPDRSEQIAGSFEVIGDSGPFKEGLKIDIAGTLDLASDGSAVLQAVGNASLGAGEYGEAAARFSLTMDARRTTESPFFELDVQARLLEVTLTDIEWDLSPVAIVRAGQVQVLADSGDHGEVADLIDLEVELLPDETDGPLVTFTVDRATGFGSLDPALVIDSFRIEGASAAFADLAVGDPSDPLLSFTDLVISIPELSNQGGTLSGQILVAAERVDLLPGNADRFQASAVGLGGSVDLDTGNLELAADTAEASIGESILVTASDAAVSWPATDGPLAEFGAATLSLPAYPNLPTTELSGLTIRRDGFSLEEFVIDVPPADGRYGLGDLLELDGLVITGSGISVAVGAEGASVAGMLAVHADMARLFPDADTPELDGVVAIDDFGGSIDLASGAMVLSAAAATATVDGIVTISASAELDDQGEVIEPAILLQWDPRETAVDAPVATIRNLNMTLPSLPGLPDELLTLDLITVRRNGFDIVTDAGGSGTNVTIGSEPELLAASDLRLMSDLSVVFDSEEGNGPPAVRLEGWFEFEATSATLLPGGPVTAAITDDDPDDGAAALSGRLNLDTQTFELIADRLTAQIEDLLQDDDLQLDVDNGVLLLSANPSADDTLFSAAEATLIVLLLGDTEVSMAAQDLRIQAGGDVSIMSAEAVASTGLAASLGLAGILPLDLTRVAIEAIDEPISLNGFDSDITVEGVFDFSLFPEAFQPTVSIGGDAPDTFALTFRLDDGVIAPWNASPITLGFTAAEVFPGFSLDGDLTLGGYERGVWGPELTGSLTARLDLDGTVETNLTVNVLPGSTLDVTTGTLNLSGEVLLDADADATFGGASLADGRLPFNLLLDVDPIHERPFFEVATFDVTFGALTIDELVIELAEAFTLTANEIEVNPDAGQDDPIAIIGTLALEVTALSGVTPAAAAHNVQLFDDRLELTSATFTLGGTVTLDETDLLFAHDLEIVFNGVVIPFGGSLSDFADGNVALPQIPDVENISVTLEAGILLPEPGTTAADLADICAGDQANGVASICGVTGAFNSNGVLTLTAKNVNANLTDVFAVHVEDGEIVLGPPALVPTDTPLMALGSATVTVPLLDDKKVSLTGNDVKLYRDGEVTIASAIAEAPAGIGTTLGLGGILPLDLTSVQIASIGAPVSLTNFGDAENPVGFDITVQGFFDFDVFGDLPFTPVIQIGDSLTDPGGTQTFEDENGTFEFTFRVQGDPEDGLLPKVSVQDLGPVMLGIEDFKPGGEDGPLTLNATVTLGGYQDGQLVKAVGGNIDVAWEEEDGPVDFAAGVEIEGELFDPGEDDNPEPSATTLRLDTTFTASLALGNQREGGEDESWGLGITDLSFQFLTTLAFDFAGDDVQLVTEPFDAVQLLGLEAERVAIDFGGVLLLEAEQVAFDFTAFDDPDKQFVTFGGDDEDGLLAISVGGEGGFLEGIGGQAGNFGLGWDPESTFRLQFVRLPGFFAAVEFPDGFKFGLPDWFPVTVSKVGIRFTDTFGDVNPPSENGSGDGGSDAVGFALDAIDNFRLIVSGGLEKSEGGWPIQGLVENMEVDIGLLRDCVEHAFENRELYADRTIPPELLQAIEEADATDIDGNTSTVEDLLELKGTNPTAFLLGVSFIAQDLLQHCELPITNLDALDVGIEPFKIGPVEIGGGLGFGVLDLDVNQDGDTDQTVLFGRVEGQFSYADSGLGVELIVTEYGPILARIFAGVPIPIGTLVGGLIGSVVPGLGTAIGASLGTQSGFILTGLQGGLVFDGKPLPIINEPIEILENPDVRFPLDISLAAIREGAAELFRDRNPDGSFEVRETPRFTWDNGFTLTASATLTNIHVHGMIGANVTLGANIGFQIDSQGALTNATDVFRDVHGNPVDPESIVSTLGDTAIDLAEDVAESFGFQFFGFGTLEVIGQGVVDAGMLFDFSDVINPVLNMAARLPQAGGWLSLLLPVQGDIGLRLETDGLLEGSVLAMQTFVSQVYSGAIDLGQDLFEQVLDQVADRLNEVPATVGVGEPRERLLAEIVHSRIGDGVTITAENLQDALLDIFGVDLENGTLVDFSHPDFNFNLAAQTAGELLNELLALGPAAFAPADLFDDDPILNAIFASLEASTFESLFAHVAFVNAALPEEMAQFRLLIEGVNISPTARVEAMKGQYDALADRLRELLDAGSTPDAGDDLAVQLAHALYTQSIGAVKAQIAFAQAVGQILFDAADSASQRFFEVINPSVTVSGQIQPTIFGIPLGEPTEEVNVTLSKHQLTLQARVGLIEKLLAPVPLMITSEELVDIHFPFENLLLDLVTGQVPRLDPLGGDWRVGLGSSIGIFGLQVGRAVGYLFPPEANELLITGRFDEDGNQIEEPILQIYNPDVGRGDEGFEELDPSRILVHKQFESRLLAEGGVLADGRLTLPRFITDPLELFGEIQDKIDAIRQDDEGNVVCDDVQSCILADPGGVFDFLGQPARRRHGRRGSRPASVVRAELHGRRDRRDQRGGCHGPGRSRHARTGVWSRCA
jgi:hypothetical protein